MSNDPTSLERVKKIGGLRNLIRKFRKPRDLGLREGLEQIIDTHQAEKADPEAGKDTTSMMRNLITFSELRVDDVMVPRADIIAMEDSSTMRELLASFTSASHSRIPIYRETLDDISGMVHVKDFMRWLNNEGSKRKTKAKSKSPSTSHNSLTSLSVSASDLNQTIRQSGLQREVLFVPPSMPAADLLVKMQSSHIHLAIVIDEYGGSDGLVSIEDLVEEIVGDISDEHDTEEAKLIKKQDENTYVADARVPISSLDTLLNVDLLPDEEEDEADTLGGLIFEMAGRVPVRGEIIPHSNGIEFEILASDPRRVKRVRIHLKKPAEAESSDQAAEKPTE